MILAVVSAGLALGMGFGLHITTAQMGLIMAFAAAVLGLITRSQVTPSSGATSPPSVDMSKIGKVAVLLAVLLATPVFAQPLSLLAVHVVNSPNTLGWPPTAHIARLEVTEQGVRPVFDKCDTWPNVTPPGWGGPLRFTLHLFLNVGGEWWESGIIQFWACDQYNGGPIYSNRQIAVNWVYDDRWGNMVNHQPAPGELIGFMVSAGNARNQDDHVVAERSAIIAVRMPTAATIFSSPFEWQEGAAPSPTPTPDPPKPPGPPTPTPPAPIDPTLSAKIDLLQSIATMRFDKLDTEVAGVKQDVADFREAVRSKWVAIVKSPYFQMTVTAVGTYITCKTTGKCG